MALVFLPWLVVVIFASNVGVGLNIMAYALIVLATGYGIVRAAAPPPARAQAIMLAPATGILTISAVSAFWLRLGLPLIWTPALWLGLAGAGIIGLWCDRALLAKRTVAYGGTLAVLSALICLVYFLPAARNDAILRRDGSFNWIYVDTQHFYSMAAAIKSGESPSKIPGASTEELLYHFAPYAPAAAISRFDGLDLGDAIARVTHGAELWALVLSCFGLGTLLSLKATGEKFGGIMAVAGLFFYGSLSSLFSGEINSASHIAGAVLFTIPEVKVIADGGPFSHLILGASVLHGLVAITAIMGLCMVERKWESANSWRVLILLALPALAVPVHSAAALYCFGVAIILLFWGCLGSARSWLQIALMFCLFIAAWKIMGLGHTPDLAGTTINTHLASQWWTVAVWVMVGLGFRIIGFRWITYPLKNPLSALVLASVVGLLAFSLVLRLQLGAERYGIYFLQSMFSIFAFSRLTQECWRGVKRSQWVAEWLEVATKGMVLLCTCGALIGAVSYVTHRHTGVAYFGTKIILSIFLLALLAETWALMKRRRRVSAVGSAILMGVLLVGFLGWVMPWFDFGLDGMKMDVTLTPGEVHGLKRLGSLAAPDERFATNKHALDSLVGLRERSYAYTALSERPVLLEGYQYRGVTSLPWFSDMLRDNDLLFTTTNPETLQSIATTWRVHWLVARPGTDIALSRPLPPWLVQQQDCGDLKIYRID
jgi:hypothetical protein